MIHKVKPSTSYVSDILASVVVFLVALPLCMGIAIASGVSPERGLITGIVGGIVVGALAGSPLQVSGPAAGLVVLVWQIIEKYGLEGLGAVVFCAGALQIGSGLLGLGQIFRAVSPTVIYGMLSGIGALIFASQFHVMFDERPSSSGVTNLVAIPALLTRALNISSANNTIALAGFTSLSTIAVILIWDRFKPKVLQLLPAALVAVLGGTLLANFLDFNIKFVEIPDQLISAISIISWSGFYKVWSADGLVEILSVAIVASAETLLCAAALDKLHGGPRTKFDKELVAQGVGNMLCGLVAALPMTGVIVRSSANIQGGAKTRASAILHGVWLLGLAVLVPGILRLIPTAALAGLLVVTGWKLINIGILKELKKRGWEEVAIFAVTVISIVCIDLLTGIFIGFSATLVQLIHRLSFFQTKLTPTGHGAGLDFELIGAASFIKLPTLSKALERIPQDKEIHVRMHNLLYIDHACLELLSAWRKQIQSNGGNVFLEWDELVQHTINKRPILRRQAA